MTGGAGTAAGTATAAGSACGHLLLLASWNKDMLVFCQ